jgi:hypothetical protein
LTTRPKKKENRTPTPTHHPPLSVDNGASCVFSSNPKPVCVGEAIGQSNVLPVKR